MSKDFEEQEAESFWTVRRVARVAVLTAVSVVAAFIKIPTPTGDVGLDSVPQYFAGMVKKWDWKEALLIGYLAKVIGSAYVGFPRGIPITLVSSLESAGLGSVVLRIPRILFNLPVAAGLAFVYNWLIVGLLFVPGLVYLLTGKLSTGWTAALAGLPGLGVASALSIGIAAGAYGVIRKGLELE